MLFTLTYKLLKDLSLVNVKFLTKQTLKYNSSNQFSCKLNKKLKKKKKPMTVK